MPLPTANFQFDYYLVDYLTQLQGLLEEQGLQIPDRMRTFFKEVSQALDVRDTDLEDFLGLGAFAPAMGLSRATTQSINHNTLTSITFDTQDFQSTDVFEWDNATRLTVKNDGVLLAIGNLRFAAHAAAAGVRFGAIYQNGIEITASMDPQAVNNVQSRLPMVDAVLALSGDYFELRAYHTQGTALNVDVAKLRLIFLGQTG
jgi:hypothetical protein